MGVSADWLTSGVSLEWPFKELQLLTLPHFGSSGFFLLCINIYNHSQSSFTLDEKYDGKFRNLLQVHIATSWSHLQPQGDDV